MLSTAELETRGRTESPCSLKRKRSDSAPLTPPLSTADADGVQILDRAVHVLSTAATALSQVTILYQSDHTARDGLLKAVERVKKVNESGGKLIICGVGKSGLVGMKMVATMKSLGLGSSFMHASEALHGDLGDIRTNDAIMFISYSGKTSELINVLHHVPDHTPVLAITSQQKPEDCQLFTERPDAILLPAPIHELEEVSFGVCAPTTSTTVAIAVGDMLALSVAEAMHQDDKKHVFQRNHPGGAIGAKSRRENDRHGKEETQQTKRFKGLASPA